ncbi:hypothetical protein, partial [Pseudomonas viridiflava]|uniref:hypothetical protein n=1 Tax=Pseudomonas viridiflava TaxID=33069 RepID=UPI00197EF51E
MNSPEPDGGTEVDQLNTCLKFALTPALEPAFLFLLSLSAWPVHVATADAALHKRLLRYSSAGQSTLISVTQTTFFDGRRR